MKTAHFILSLLLVAACIAVPAFGNGGEEEEAGPIKIGAIFSETGPVSFLGAPEANTARMMQEKINEEGGVLGRPIEIIIKDDQASTEKTLSFAKQLVEEEGVIAIIGPTGSGNTMTIKDYMEESQTILLSCAAAEAIVEPLADYVFKTPQKDSDAIRTIFITMNDMGITRIGALAGATGFGNEGLKQMQALAPEYGIKIAIAETYSIREADFTGVVTKVKAADVEAVVNWSVFPAQSIIPKNMAQLGFDVPLFCSHGFGNIKYVEAAGEAAEGIYFPCGRLLAAEQLPASHPQQEVLVGYKTAYESEFDGEAVSTFGGHAYDALTILIEAIKKAESTDKEEVRAAIETITGFPGTGGVFNYSPTDHNGLGLNALTMYVVEDGNFVLYEK